jgi:hypothetical protein
MHGAEKRSVFKGLCFAVTHFSCLFFLLRDFTSRRSSFFPAGVHSRYFFEFFFVVVFLARVGSGFGGQQERCSLNRF